MKRKTQRQTTTFATKLLAALFAAIIALISVHLLLQYLNLNVYHELNGRVFELSNRVDLDDEASIPTWFSQLLFLGIGMAAFLASYLQKVAGAKRIWSLIGTFGVVLSLDEISALHEALLQTIHLLFFGENAPTIVDNAWLVLLPFVLIAAGILLKELIKYAPKRIIGFFIIGGVIFLSGAVFIDILTNSSAQNTFFDKGILVAVEEGCELIGTSIILYAIVNYLEQSFGAAIRQATKQLRNSRG